MKTGTRKHGGSTLASSLSAAPDFLNAHFLSLLHLAACEREAKHREAASRNFDAASTLFRRNSAAANVSTGTSPENHLIDLAGALLRRPSVSGKTRRPVSPTSLGVDPLDDLATL